MCRVVALSPSAAPASSSPRQVRHSLVIGQIASRIPSRSSPSCIAPTRTRFSTLAWRVFPVIVQNLPTKRKAFLILIGWNNRVVDCSQKSWGIWSRIEIIHSESGSQLEFAATICLSGPDVFRGPFGFREPIQ